MSHINSEASGFGGSVVVSIIDCVNNGDVTGRYIVGGIVGRTEGDTSGSVIDGCVNHSIINAEAYVGCIARHTSTYVIKNSDNENSQLNASGYYLENGSKYAYVGGLVGRGPCVENCTNYVDINYTGGGDFTGGVMEYFELGAAITGSGITSSEASASFKKLKNLGNISGNSYVGGIAGGVMYFWDNGCKPCTVTFEKFENASAIVGKGNYVGGIVGYACGDVGGISGSLDWSIYDCINSADISGKANVAGLFGGFKNGEAKGSAYKDNIVSIVDCVSTGKVKANYKYGDIIGLNEIVK